MSRAIVIGDREYPVIADVKLWTETGLQVRIGDGYNKRRRREIDLAVWHWTGGEGDPERLFGVLKSRDLGIEFAIHRGVIWQYCDPIIVDTADAGFINARSVGTEIVNYGYRAKNRPIPRAGARRSTYGCTFRDKRRKFAHFDPNDIAAAISLASALSAALPIPRRVPLAPDGLWVESSTMTRAEIDAYAGHLGHFHVSDRKADPGLDLLEAFRAAWSDEL